MAKRGTLDQEAVAKQSGIETTELFLLFQQHSGFAINALQDMFDHMFYRTRNKQRKIRPYAEMADIEPVRVCRKPEM